MQLYFLTSVGWSRDSSGNLQAIDTAGNTVAKFIGGSFSATINKGTAANNAPITSTTSTTDVHTGYYTQITPQISGNIIVFCEIINVFSNTAGDGVALNLYETSGANSPAGGSAVTGWSQLTSSAMQIGLGGASEFYETHLMIYAAARITGTTYTYGLTARAVIGGTANWRIQNQHPLALEI